jgi:hypothetical protein
MKHFSAIKSVTAMEDWRIELDTHDSNLCSVVDNNTDPTISLMTGPTIRLINSNGNAGRTGIIRLGQHSDNNNAWTTAMAIDSECHGTLLQTAW